jgi:hypothetical protein
MDAESLTGANVSTGDGGMLWVYFPLDRRWWAACRLVPQEDQLEVAELRILPRPRDKLEKEWAIETLKSSQQPKEKRPYLAFEGKKLRPAVEPPTREPRVPRGGLTVRKIRDFRIGRVDEILSEDLTGEVAEYLESVLEHMDRRQPFHPEPERVAENMAALSGLRAAIQTGQPGRRGRPDHFYAEVADVYVALARPGEPRPTVATARALSERLGQTFTPTQVRDLLNEARNRKLLTRPPKGKSGGRLTKQGERALEEGKNA